MKEKLTFEQAKKNHRELWLACEQRPDLDKGQVFRLIWGDTDVAVNCWLCEYVEQNIPYGTTRCPFCPADWGDKNCEESSETLYGKYKNSTGWQRAKYAHEIATMPLVNKFKEKKRKKITTNDVVVEPHEDGVAVKVGSWYVLGIKSTGLERYSCVDTNKYFPLDDEGRIVLDEDK